jgi:ArsR family transcriptional regulator
MHHACRADLLNVAFDEAALADHLTMLKALAHPVRLRMVEMIRLHQGELCVCEFKPHFELTQPTISHHLKILRDAGLIRSRQDGTWVHHSIEPEAFDRLVHLIEAFVRESATPV